MAKHCGARTRAGTPCRRPAGWGTAHVGEGRCKLHGGNAGAPSRNRNAVTTGEYETIWLDQLDDEERVLFDRILPDVLAQLNDEIRLVTIRERRMLQRIARLSETDFTLVETSHEEGLGPHGPVDRTTQKREATLGQIQRIEEALTRVQAQKARMLDLKHKIESGFGPEEPDIQRYVEALRGAAADAWGDEDEGDDADASA